MSASTAPDDARAVDFGSSAKGGAAAVGAVAGAALVVLIAAVTSWSWPGIAVSASLVPATMAAAVDVRTRRLPDLMVASSAAVAVFVAVVARGGLGLAIAAAGAACVAGPIFALHLAAPSSMAFGDVKLGGALGATVGVVSTDLAMAVLLAMATLAVASAAGMVAAVSMRRRDIAFGPALVVGAGVALIAAERLGGAPLSWR